MRIFRFVCDARSSKIEMLQRVYISINLQVFWMLKNVTRFVSAIVFAWPLFISMEEGALCGTRT